MRIGHVRYRVEPLFDCVRSEHAQLIGVGWRDKQCVGGVAASMQTPTPSLSFYFHTCSLLPPCRNRPGARQSAWCSPYRCSSLLRPAILTLNARTNIKVKDADIVALVRICKTDGENASIKPIKYKDGDMEAVRAFSVATINCVVGCVKMGN